MDEDKEKLPGPLNHPDLLDLLHNVFIVTKWTAGLIEKLSSLGFSYPEKNVFSAMPIALRQAYKLTKEDMCQRVNLCLSQGSPC